MPKWPSYPWPTNLCWMNCCQPRTCCCGIGSVAKPNPKARNNIWPHWWSAFVQPVTIHSKHWIHSLWWVQVALLATAVAVMWAVTLGGSGWLLLSWPLLMCAMWRNQRTIKQQQSCEFHWTAKGRRFYRDTSSAKSSEGPEGHFAVSAWWPMPGLILLRLSAEPGGSVWHLTVRRIHLGPVAFSNLWVHLSATTEQPNTSS